VEAGWHHAHDLARLAVEGDRAADRAGIAAEAALPERVAQQDDPVASRPVFAVFERAPEGGSAAQHGEQVGRDGASHEALRLAGSTTG
jgi:hypothetical protein